MNDPEFLVRARLAVRYSCRGNLHASVMLHYLRARLEKAARA